MPMQTSSTTPSALPYRGALVDISPVGGLRHHDATPTFPASPLRHLAIHVMIAAALLGLAILPL